MTFRRCYGSEFISRDLDLWAYCSPPEHSRFKKGKSGNPKGRPKKPDDIFTVLNRALNRKVTVQGQERKVPMRKALIRKLRELALSGDRRALDLQRRILAEANGGEVDRYDPEETRQKVLRAFENMGVKVNYNE